MFIAILSLVLTAVAIICSGILLMVFILGGKR